MIKNIKWICPFCDLKFSCQYDTLKEDAKIEAYKHVLKHLTHHIINTHNHEKEERNNKWLN